MTGAVTQTTLEMEGDRVARLIAQSRSAARIDDRPRPARERTINGVAYIVMFDGS